MNKFHIAINPVGSYLVRFKSDTGKTIFYAATFSTKAACLQTIAQIRVSVERPERFIRKGMENGRCFFVLQSEKGRSIGVSEIFDNERTMEDAITQLQMTAPAATLVYDKQHQDLSK
ncbi:hypothetical protein MKQ68_22600 [Chitinophaga horti]|uniref:DUF1508 domain-containing protein n=1 Tax=Chitinophaga horti TaxID=2920382 RepID=A0ABY6J3W3_9BACT|nr:hypothetical protein [Chitinophaga horti]UYQ92874.1 hypothetical protein MKQ68_22600 [Chitinophaga horti]